jgi:hypothetical protein
MKKIIIIAFIFLFTSLILSADVIRMKNGRIFIGRVLTVNPEGVVILSLKEKFTVNFNEILKTDPDFRNLQDRELEITLKDNSKMLGKVKDYDPDIGLLMEIDFGMITLPLENVKSIMDYTQQRKTTAHFMQIGTQGGYYFIIGDLSSIYTSNFDINLFWELNLDFLLPGLFAGATLSYHNLTCIDYTDFSYLLFNLNISGIYRLLIFRTESGFLRNLVPFAAIGAGAACPLQTVNEDTAMEIDLSFTASLGVDYFIFDDIFIRLSGVWTTVLQSEIWFNTIAINLGAAYGF